jgi:hypothetical protein
MKIKVTIQHIGENDPWVEEIKVANKTNAKEEIETIISDFNISEKARYGNKAKFRELVSIGEVIKEKEIALHEYKFKPNPYIPIDEILCKNCIHELECINSLCDAYDYLTEYDGDN